MIDEQTKQMVRAKVEEMLNDPTLVISSECGIVRRPNYDTGYMEEEPTGGYSITFTVRGGGGVHTEHPNESALRLVRELQRAAETRSTAPGSDTPA